MKKLVLLFIALAFSGAVVAQVIVIQTTLVASREINEATKKFNPWSEWTESSVIVTIDVKNNLVKMDNKFNDKFKLLAQVEHKKGVDPTDKEPFEEIVSSAVDAEGLRLYVSIKVFESGLYHVMAVYPNIAYVYQGSPIFE